MSGDASNESGPDLAQGVPIESLGEASLLSGHVGHDAVLIARLGNEFFAIDAACTHYHGPLVEGLIVGDTVRCPWHHACFSLRTGKRYGRLRSALSCAGLRRSGATGLLSCTKKRHPRVP